MKLFKSLPYRSRVFSCILPGAARLIVGSISSTNIAPIALRLLYNSFNPLIMLSPTLANIVSIKLRELVSYLPILTAPSDDSSTPSEVTSCPKMSSISRYIKP